MRVVFHARRWVRSDEGRRKLPPSVFSERENAVVSLPCGTMEHQHVPEPEDTADDSHLTELASPLARPEDLTPDCFPRLYNLSARFRWSVIAVPREYVHIPELTGQTNEESTRRWLWLNDWNWAWESGPLRLGMFDEDEVPADLRWLGDHENADLRLVLDGHVHPYAAYAPLYHLLPLGALKRFGLPALKRGLWPDSPSGWRRDQGALPKDLKRRLGGPRLPPLAAHRRKTIVERLLAYRAHTAPLEQPRLLAPLHRYGRARANEGARSNRRRRRQSRDVGAPSQRAASQVYR
jgi:hypothetical protein